MNARCRVTGSRTVEPQQHHSTQENGPSNASRCVGGRLSSAGRCGFGPGVHETLKQVQALYAQMIWSRWTYFTVGVLAGIIGGLVVLVIPPAVRYVASLRWWS